MKNHTDVLIFHTAICVGASQISPDGRRKLEICVAPSRKRSGMEKFMYRLLKQEGRAKRGEFTTVHGVIQTPVFMNVGTVAAIKGAVSTEDLEQIGRASCRERV